MKQIAIIGCPGSGKSTLAVELGKRTGLPVFHLDEPYHNARWPENLEERRQVWREYQENLVAQPRWIIDGNYQRTLQVRVNAADTIIFLDFSPHLCLWRVMKRRLSQICGRKAAGANPERIDWAFLRFVWNYPQRERREVLNLLATQANVHTLRSPRKLKKFLKNSPWKHQ